MTSLTVVSDVAIPAPASGVIADTPHQPNPDIEPPLDTPSKDLETGGAASLVRVKAGPKRTSIWDGMVLMITPATNEESKAQEWALQAKTVRRRLFLMGFLAVAVVAVTIGLSIGLTGGNVGDASTSSGTDGQQPLANAITDTSPDRRRTDAPTSDSNPNDPTTPINHAPTTGEPFANVDPTPSTATAAPMTTTVAPTTTRAPTTTTTTTVPPASLDQMLNFVNRCTYPISVFKVDRLLCTLQPNGQCGDTLIDREHTMYRHTKAADATLVEVTFADRKLWYDISAIPPGCGNGMSYAECVRNSGGAIGYNVPVSVFPTKYDGNPRKGNCHQVTCTQPACPDAYLYPFDDWKMKDCPDDEVFLVTFCP
ncbi:hypothetical protein H310_02182 [Aphanomyces invadans]|uniref:Uncharacterized protein n=1 Tax=Aphanomyces invadans TaxID=157072 RepID=A0A024UN55_9STRA|nr:hypothetical protein H310_02182 [Aphanomyces invadans]ETW07739.1 hypothetical protein H310_02182 [Aphanomyces invadans]|eukprot:XP_008863832.1 hypothetical protein H310_02182 [Aphanomyces invadans]